MPYFQPPVSLAVAVAAAAAAAVAVAVAVAVVAMMAALLGRWLERAEPGCFRNWLDQAFGESHQVTPPPSHSTTTPTTPFADL